MTDISRYERQLFNRSRTEQGVRNSNEMLNQDYHAYLLNYILHLEERIDNIEEALEAIEFPNIVPLVEYNYDFSNNDEQQFNGALQIISTGITVRQGFPAHVFTKGSGKVFFNTTALLAGASSGFVIGDTIDRDTGVVTVSDIEAVAFDVTTFDGSSTDAHGNTIHNFSNAVMTSNWFVGSCTFLITSSGGRFDGDVGHCSFEQWNDSAEIEIQTLDLQSRTENATVDLDVYLYSVIEDAITGRFAIRNEAALTIDNSAGAGSGDNYHRLRIGEIALNLSGATDGTFVDTHLSAGAGFFKNLEVKVWGNITGTASVDVPPPVTDPPTIPGGGIDPDEPDLPSDPGE